MIDARAKAKEWWSDQTESAKGQPGTWSCNKVISSYADLARQAGAILIECGLIAAGISATVGLALTVLHQPQCSLQFFTFTKLFDAPAREVGSRT
ncbi:hypothetical protein ACVWYH_002226 [Bradyrhizobium sp. GM24.11]